MVQTGLKVFGTLRTLFPEALWMGKLRFRLEFFHMIQENDGTTSSNCEYHLYLRLTLKNYEQTLFYAHQRSCLDDGILREAG